MKIGILGRVADGIDLYDGQTIKTRVFRDQLEKSFPESEVICLDTYEFKKNIFKNIIGLFFLLNKCDCIFVLLSVNGRKVCFPLIYFLNKYFKKNIYHNAIGGFLANETRKNKAWIKYLNSFSVNWVELPSLKENLNKLGIKNAQVLPNFKNVNILKEEDICLKKPNVYRFCTFSRVTESKGILEAINAINYVNSKANCKIAELYIYGSVEDEFKEKFERALKINNNTIFYMGTTSYNKSVEEIKKYYMLLFPSTFIGEGFPGTIIDAFSAALPVIASNWNYNGEVIEEGKTGFCYDYKNPNNFYELVEFCTKNPDLVLNMKKNCLKEVSKYLPDNVMNIVSKQIEKDLTF